MRALVIKLLKDGSGRACIHWFTRDAKGPIETPGGATLTAAGPVKIAGARGRIVCHPDQNTILPQLQNGETFLCLNSDDPRAVTCPECMTTDEFKAAMRELEGILETAARAAG